MNTNFDTVNCTMSIWTDFEEYWIILNVQEQPAFIARRLRITNCGKYVIGQDIVQAASKSGKLHSIFKQWTKNIWASQTTYFPIL